jgi:hypothetical protein
MRPVLGPRPATARVRARIHDHFGAKASRSGPATLWPMDYLPKLVRSLWAIDNLKYLQAQWNPI